MGFWIEIQLAVFGVRVFRGALLGYRHVGIIRRSATIDKPFCRSAPDFSSARDGSVATRSVWAARACEG
jgi:hypothetical protein